MLSAGLCVTGRARVAQKLEKSEKVRMRSLPCSGGDFVSSTSCREDDMPLASRDHDVHDGSDLAADVMSEEEEISSVYTAVSVRLQK